jgi:hypothetical protein
MNCAIVLYTHTDVKDVWPPFFGQTDKFLPDSKKYIFVNEDDNNIPSNYNKVYYDDSKIYRERFLTCLEQIDDEFVMIHHEDMFLYGKPDIERLINYQNRLTNQYSFVKLIRGGNSQGKSDDVYPELKLIDKSFEYIFAIQPTIWKTDKLIELLKHSEGNSIWEFEVAAQRTCRDRDILGYYVDDGGIQRGRFHWDSKVYPYVATAVVKGKWNTKEYPKELEVIGAEYNIDYETRGTND